MTLQLGDINPDSETIALPTSWRLWRSSAAAK
jgi:hypothetical protein